MLLILPAVMALALILVFWRRQKALTALRREAYIRNFTLPPRLFEPLRTQHPHLSLKDCQLVAQGLRQFFLAYLKSGQRYVSMPSQVVARSLPSGETMPRPVTTTRRDEAGREAMETPLSACGSRHAKRVATRVAGAVPAGICDQPDQRIGRSDCMVPGPYGAPRAGTIAQRHRAATSGPGLDCGKATPRRTAFPGRKRPQADYALTCALT